MRLQNALVSSFTSVPDSRILSDYICRCIRMLRSNCAFACSSGQWRVFCSLIFRVLKPLCKPLCVVHNPNEDQVLKKATRATRATRAISFCFKIAKCMFGEVDLFASEEGLEVAPR
jgi:hypothetical protein